MSTLTPDERSEINQLLLKVKNASLETPQNKRVQTKKKQDRNQEGGKIRRITDNIFETHVDLQVKHSLYINKFNTLSLTIHGFVPSSRAFNDKVVAPSMNTISERLGIRDDTHLMLDLRTLFFVSQNTCETILYQHLPWLHARFNRVCVLLPSNPKVREIITKSLMSIDIDLPPIEMQAFDRAREGQAFLDTRA